MAFYHQWVLPVEGWELANFGRRKWTYFAKSVSNYISLFFFLFLYHYFLNKHTRALLGLKVPVSWVGPLTQVVGTTISSIASRVEELIRTRLAVSRPLNLNTYLLHQVPKQLPRSTRCNFYGLDRRSEFDHFYGLNDQSKPANFCGHVELDDDGSPLGRQARPLNSTSLNRTLALYAT